MVDFGAIIGLLYELVFAGAAAALGVAVPFAINWLKEKAGLDKLVADDVVRGYVNTALERGIAFARTELDEEIAKVDGTIDLGMKNQLVEIAINYVLDAVPDGLERFGINSPEVVAKLVTARLDKILSGA